MVDPRELQTGKHIAKIDVGATSITWIVGLQSGVSPSTPRNAKTFASGGLGLESIKIFKPGLGIESSTPMSRFHIWGLVRPTSVLGCPTEREHFEGQGKIVGPEESNGGSLWEVASNNDPLDKTNCVTNDILWCRMLLLNSEIAGALNRLDQTLGLGARMALGLDKFSSTDVALVLANIRPAGPQILRRLSSSMVRNWMYDLVDLAMSEPRITYVFSREWVNHGLPELYFTMRF